ncbi:MAG: V-type ATP synthase subunit E, partial [Bacillota bacterium]|nr:V-type ATP synthase subunit E [Bacillota bacterium]
QAKERVRRAVSSLELEARKNLLAKKQELITVAFDAAFDNIMKLPEDRYVAFLCRLACEASLTGNEEVVLSPADRSRFGKQVVIGANSLLGQAKKSAALTLSQEMRPINGGLVLKSGDTEVNCTLDTIVRLIKNDLAFDVAKVLFQ